MAERIYPDLPRVYFDMDGVLADFVKESVQRNIPLKELKLKVDAYRYLPVMEGAKEAVQRAIDAGYDVFVLTKIPRENFYAATEKLFWIDEHFPILNDKVIISPDKGAVGTERDILIDDHPEWANANNFRGTIIKFVDNWDVLYEKL